jgi:hypothetical protein
VRASVRTALADIESTKNGKETATEFASMPTTWSSTRCALRRTAVASSSGLSSQ